MASVTLSELRSRVRARADQENSSFVTDARLNAFINTAADELHGKLSDKFGENYSLSQSTFSTVAGTDTVALPTDFFRLLSVELQSGGRWVPLRRFSVANRSKSTAANGIGAIEYALRGSSIWLAPAPSGVFSGQLFYIPLRTQLALDADALTGFNGWEEYVVVRAAIMCLDKEESDTSALRADLAMLDARIESEAQRRDAGQPASVVDVARSCDDGWT